MKKLSVLILGLWLLVLAGCNPFEKLDKRSSSMAVKEYELNQKMNSGDYDAVVRIVEDIIQSSPELKEIDNKDEGTLQKYLITNINQSTVQNYINLKTREAIARQGASNLKVSDLLTIIADLDDKDDKNANYIAKSESGNEDKDDNIEITEIILKLKGVRWGMLRTSADSYLKALPRTEAAYDILKRKDAKYTDYYMSGALVIAIDAVNHALELIGFSLKDIIDDAEDMDDEELEEHLDKKFKNFDLSWKDFENDYKENWNSDIATVRSKLRAVVDMIEILGDSLGIDDIDEVREDAEKIIDELININNVDDYNKVRESLGLGQGDE